MALITIGGTPFPGNPTKYEVKNVDFDSDSSIRSETGVLYRDRVRSGVYTIGATYLCSKADLKTIADLLAPKSFSATFFDPFLSADPTKTMYCGDRTATLSQYVNEAAPTASYWELSFQLIQY